MSVTRGRVAGARVDIVESLQLAIEAVATGIFVADPNGKLVLVNRELARQFGYAPHELVGQSVDGLLPERQRPLHLMPPQQLVQDFEAPPMDDPELFGRRKDGSEFPIEIELNRIETSDGNLVIGSITDVTERRHLANLHRIEYQDRRQFERLVADLSGQFISVAPDNIDQVIRRALRQICEVLNLDWGRLLRIGSDGSAIHATGWTADWVPTPAGVASAREEPPSGIARTSNEALIFSTLTEIPSEVDRRDYRDRGAKSGIRLPLTVAGRLAGVLELGTLNVERKWTSDVVHQVEVVANLFSHVLARQQRDEELQKALLEVERLKDQLQAENVYLRHEAREWRGATRIVGHSLGIRQVLEQIEQVAATDSTVLLVGETGTGKELFATQIHEMSSRSNRGMVRVNCAAIPSTLIESELFGREKGAFTGSLARQIGRFELADRSTIFLDEIGDLPPEVQVKLLRVLEERQIERLGNPRSIVVDVRIIAATHRNLEQRITEGVFREDLYYRLNVFPIRVPPLRERMEDIPLLVWRFVEEFSNAFGKRIESITKESLAALQQYSWPGNIRELRNVVERAMIVATSPRLAVAVPQASVTTPKRSSRLQDVEKEHIRGVLESAGWRIRGVGGAADRLGMKPTTLETRMAKLGLKRPRP